MHLGQRTIYDDISMDSHEGPGSFTETVKVQVKPLEIGVILSTVRDGAYRNLHLDVHTARQLGITLLMGADVTEKAQRDREARKAELETQIETAQRIYGWDSFQAVSNSLVTALGADGLRDLHDWLTTGSDISAATRNGLQNLADDVAKRDYTPPKSKNMDIPVLAGGGVMKGTYSYGEPRRPDSLVDRSKLPKSPAESRSQRLADLGYGKDEVTRILELAKEQRTSNDFNEQERNIVGYLDNVMIAQCRREGLNGISPEDLLNCAIGVLGTNWVSSRCREFMALRAASILASFFPDGSRTDEKTEP